jgi:putative Ca2+/H+ antiporter (TMEM165/GDT1 family)
VLTWFLLAYGGVFAAEALYDNSLYTTTTLATRYRSLLVLCGAASAFMAKMLMAVSIGAAFGKLLESEVVQISTKLVGVLTFLVLAIVLWLRKPQGEQVHDARSGSQIAVISFFAVLCCELFDDGQAVAGLLAARAAPGPHSELAISVIWLGATLALVTKGIFAVTLGVRIQKWIPHTALRYMAIALCIGLAAFAWLKRDEGEKLRGAVERRGEAVRMVARWQRIRRSEEREMSLR